MTNDTASENNHQEQFRADASDELPAGYERPFASLFSALGQRGKEIPDQNVFSPPAAEDAAE